MEENIKPEEKIIESPTAPQPKASISPYMTPVSILLAGIFIALAVFYSRGATGQTGAPNNIPQQPPVDIKNITTENEPYIGSATAPVTIAYWSDYQCPYCKKFETETLPSVIDTYVKTNKVKIIFKDIPFLGSDSATAALFGRAVWELYPDKFFTWREAMYKAQDKENGGFGDEASIVALTKTIPGIDVTKITSAVDKTPAKYQTLIDADRTEAVAVGIQGTPNFVIGKQLVLQLLPYVSFKQLIDAQLK